LLRKTGIAKTSPSKRKSSTSKRSPEVTKSTKRK